MKQSSTDQFSSLFSFSLNKIEFSSLAFSSGTKTAATVLPSVSQFFPIRRAATDDDDEIYV